MKNNESLSIKFENIVYKLGKELYSYVKIQNPILKKVQMMNKKLCFIQ
jgi:hypothetical protein